MKFITSIFALVCFADVASAGTLRAAPEEGANAETVINSDRELTDDYWNGPVFYMQSYGAGSGYYLGHDPTDNYAWIKPGGSGSRFVYTKDYHLEKWNDNGKTGKCYWMGDDYKTSLKNCDYSDEKQKWLLAKDPTYYDGDDEYYTITNSYYGYALEYDPTDLSYYIKGTDWKTVDYYGQDNKFKNLLFYKQAAYQRYNGRACRTSSGHQGVSGGKDYIKYDDKNRAECRKICDKDDKCKGWEYYSNDRRCEKWFTEPKQFAWASGFDCYVKQHY